MFALTHYSTWELIPLPSPEPTMGCRWVFTVKCHFNGYVECYKARLAAKKYTGTHGVDYEETFSPVAIELAQFGSHLP